MLLIPSQSDTSAHQLWCTGCDRNTVDRQQHILIEGSNALRPFISAIVPLFQGQHIQLTAKVKGGGNAIQSANIQVQGGGSITGLEAMERQKTDITMTDIYADPAAYSSPNLSDQIIIVIPYTLIVNPDLAAVIHSLTSQQISDIFSFHLIQNWSQIGGPNLPVVPISEADNMETHGNTNFFQTTVLDDNPRWAPLSTETQSWTPLPVHRVLLATALFRLLLGRMSAQLPLMGSWLLQTTLSQTVITFGFTDTSIL